MKAFSFSDDHEMFEAMKQKLYSAVLSDALDQVGHRDRAMRADIRPVFAEAILVGRAHTVLAVDVYETEIDSYEMEIEAVDSLTPGRVLVASTGRSTRNCLWGELLSTASLARGARGAIIDGYVRDVRQIREMRFPVFSTGMKPVDSMGRGKVIDYGCPINCGDVVVQPDEIVFGDIDGVVAIPKAVEKEVIERAFCKVEGEDRARKDLQQGAFLKDVYQKYGIL
jgi:regulator of RNase E activity RraA